MDLCIWDKCNNRCKTCSNPDLPWKSIKTGIVKKDTYSYEEIISRIENRRKNGRLSNYILMTGGEPTLHPRFLDLLKYISKNFPDKRIGLLTNGRLFLYKTFTQEVLKINNLHIGTSIYGHNDRAHDRVTQAKGSFEQTISGLKNILLYRNPTHQIEVRTVISKLSYLHLDKMVGLVSDQFPLIDRFILIFLEFEGQAVKYLKETKVSYAQVASQLKKAQPFFKEFKEIRLYHFPLCTLDPSLWPYVWRTLPKSEITFLSSCQNCKYRKYCLGIHKDHIKYMGDKEFKPIKKKIKIISRKNDFKHHPIERVIF